jgi:glucokinase
MGAGAVRDDRRGLVVGVDLGGTKIAAGVVGPDGTLRGEVHRRPTPAAQGPEAVLDAVAAAVGDAFAPATAGPLGVGVGTAGVVDAARGVVLSATASMPGWPGTDVAEGLRRRLGVDLVHVQNDVDAHATGESWVGAAASAASALVVAVGTGVGGSLVLQGRPWRGARFVAGEVGHIPAPGAEHLCCACGRLGHLEAIGAGPGLHRHYLSLGGDDGVPDSRAVVRLAGEGDATATTAVRESARAVGRVVAGLVTTLDPEVVVLAGGLVDVGALWWRPMEEALRTELIDVLQDVPVRPAMLGGGAAVIGAARPVWQSWQDSRTHDRTIGDSSDV